MNAPQTSRSQRGYDRLAPYYSRLEWIGLGRQLQEARFSLLTQIPPWNQMLILGDGNGRLVEQFCLMALAKSGDCPAVHITSVDHSRAMLDLQRSRIQAIGAESLVELVQEDALQYEPESGTYDILVTPFFLDCFTESELHVHLPRWLSCLRPGGLLYHVDFIYPKRPLQRPRARLLLWLMHSFFRRCTGLSNRRLVEIPPLLRQLLFRQVTEWVGGHGMITAQLWQRS